MTTVLGLLLVFILVFAVAFGISYIFFDRTPSEVAEEAEEQIVELSGATEEEIRKWWTEHFWP